MRWNVLAVALVGALTACADDPFSPEDVAGFYPLASVDGHDIGWYHHVAGADCQFAFTAGGLEILVTGAFELNLDYDVRCFGTNPFDALGFLRVFGERTREDKDLVLLEGRGPDLVYPAALDNWTLEVQRSGDHLTLRFTDAVRTWWADPVLVLGP